MNSSSFARSLPSDDRKQKTIAIVGSGMAGLTTAYLLNGDRKQRYNVKVFEMVCIMAVTCVHRYSSCISIDLDKGW